MRYAISISLAKSLAESDLGDLNRSRTLTTDSDAILRDALLVDGHTANMVLEDRVEWLAAGSHTALRPLVRGAVSLQHLHIAAVCS